MRVPIPGSGRVLGLDPTSPQYANTPGQVVFTPDGSQLYVQTVGNGIVDEFAVGTGASLAQIGAVTVPGAVGGEGIVAF